MKSKLSQTIRSLRKEHWLTQKEVAAAVGKTRGAYSLIEAGINIPSIITIQKLAEFYRVSTDAILNGKVAVS